MLFLGEGPLEAAMRNMGIPAATAVWSGDRSDLTGAWKVWKWLRRHPAKIAHLHHGGRTVWAVCRLAGVRVVVQHMHSRILENDGTSVSRLSIRHADAVIANSRAVAECLGQCNPEVIYAGLETGLEPPAPAPFTGPLKVGVIARLVPLKNIQGAINATARLAAHGVDVQFEIAGSGPLEHALKDLVVNLGLTDRVRFLGWQADVRRLLPSWHLLVIPSLEEGFGLAALEGMAEARAVLASRVGGLRELVVDGVTGRLVPPGDTDAIVECIADLASDRQRLAAMGVEGWKRAHDFFSATQMAQRTAQVYDSLL